MTVHGWVDEAADLWAPPRPATGAEILAAMRAAIDAPYRPFQHYVSPWQYEAMLADPWWNPEHVHATRTIPKDRLHATEPEPRPTVGAPVLIDNVLRAAAAACTPPYVVAPPRTNPSTHFTLLEDGTLLDHRPFLGHRDAYVPTNRIHAHQIVAGVLT